MSEDIKNNLHRGQCMTGENDYCIFHGANAGELVNQVRAAMNNGWVPQGGVSVIAYRNDYGYFYQAMVRSE